MMTNIACSSCLKHALLSSIGVLQLQTHLLTQHTDTSGPNNLPAIISITMHCEDQVFVSCASCKAPMTAICLYMHAQTHTFCSLAHFHHSQLRHIKQVMHALKCCRALSSKRLERGPFPRGLLHCLRPWQTWTMLAK